MKNIKSKRFGLKLLLVSMTLGSIVIFSTSLTAQAGPLQQMKNHMDYKGYKCDVQVTKAGRRMRCTTEKAYPNFQMREMAGGFLISSYFSGSQYAKRHRAAFLNLVNNLNVMSIATRYYIDRDTDLALECWIPGNVYRKQTFESVLTNFNNDWDRIFAKFGDEVRQFLR